MMTTLILGAIVGAILGMLGAGGSTLAIPLLAYGVGLEPREAIATSLIVVGLAAWAGAVRHWRQGTIDVRTAVTFGLSGFTGSAAGAQLAGFLEPAFQMTLFALTLIAAAVYMLGSSPLQGTAAPARPVSLPILLAGLGAGMLTGLVGVGGGFVIVPLLVFAAGMPMQRAVGTSLLVISFNALGGLASYLSYVSLATAVWFPFAAGAILAALGGAAASRHFGELKLRSAFAVGLIVLGVFTLAKEGIL